VIPAAVIRLLGRRLAREGREPAPEERVCRGTLLSRAQYLTDVFRRGYADARLAPDGGMTPEDVALWTAAIETEEKSRNAAGRGR
jgi:hypothetical protein